jgi:hypothetical protein
MQVISSTKTNNNNVQKRGIRYQEGFDRDDNYNNKEEKILYGDNYSVGQLGKVKCDVRYQGSSDNGKNINKGKRMIYSKEYYREQLRKVVKRGGRHQEESPDKGTKNNDEKMTYSGEYYKDHHFQNAKRTSDLYYNSHKKFKRGLYLNTAYKSEVIFDKQQIASSAATSSSSLVPSSLFIFTILLVFLYRILKH